MTASTPWAAPLAALQRNAGLAVTVLVFAWLAALPAHDGVAQDQSPSPAPGQLWKAYPLDPTVEPGTQREQASTPTTKADAHRSTASTTSAGGDGGAPVFVLMLAALVAAGGMLTFVGIRRRHESEPAAAVVPRPLGPATDAPSVPALWHGSSSRFSRALTKTPAIAALATTRGPDGERPFVAPDPPRRAVPAKPAARAPSPVTPAGSPPDPRLGWTAEIEWREVDGKSRFCVIARGAGTLEIAQSPPLDWPPEGPAAVQAVTNAADKLAATLVAAGWKPLPPGSAWYAKRFAWEPSESTGPKAVAPLPETSDEGDTPEGVRSGRARAKQFALLALFAVVAVIVALRLGDGSDGAGAGKSGAKPHEGIDLSVPLLVVVGLVLLVLAIRQFRSTLRRTPPQGTKGTRSPR